MGRGPGAGTETLCGDHGFEGREHLVGPGPPLGLLEPDDKIPWTGCGVGDLANVRGKSPRISFYAFQATWYQVACIGVLSVGWTITSLLTIVIFEVPRT